MQRLSFHCLFSDSNSKRKQMIKVLYSSIIISVLLLSACDSTEKHTEKEWQIYKSSMDHGDRTTAMNSLNRIIAFEKYEANALDTLAILYLQSGANEAAVTIAKRALNVRESDELIYTLAKASKGLGNYEVALENYQKLLTKKPDNLELLYEVAYANINLSKLSEALPHIKTIIQHPESGSAVMQEFIADGSQLLPYKAVAYNMLGFLQTKAGQDQEAVKSYEAAIQIFPKYYLANNNLKVMLEKLKEGN